MRCRLWVVLSAALLIAAWYSQYLPKLKEIQSVVASISSAPQLSSAADHYQTATQQPTSSPPVSPPDVSLAREALTVPGESAAETTSTETGKIYAAVLVIGSVRTFRWPSVCENAKYNLHDGLAGDDPTVRVDSFFFLSLDDEARDAKTMLRVEGKSSNILDPCIKVWEPVHVELMPKSYEMPQDPCPGHPEHRAKMQSHGPKSAATWSQCTRLKVAFEYVRYVHEPKAGIEYKYFVRIRPDMVWMQKVPPLRSLPQVVYVAGMSKGDHFHLVDRSCPDAWYCGGVGTTIWRCPGETHPCSVNRTRHLDFQLAIVREFPGEDGDKDAIAGVLKIECYRTEDAIQEFFPKAYKDKKVRSKCEKFAKQFVKTARPPAE